VEKWESGGAMEGVIGRIFSENGTAIRDRESQTGKRGWGDESSSQRG